MTELNDKQKTAINTLRFINTPCSLNSILSKSNGYFDSKIMLKTVLGQLVDLKLVTLQGNGYYKISFQHKNTNLTGNKLVPLPSKKPISTPAKIKPSNVSPKNTSIAENPKVKIDENAIFESLDSLANRLKVSMPTIERAEMKLKVLDKLSRILDPEIGDVLDEIHTDLSKMIANINKTTK
jgi:hypothetical protein